MCKVPLVRAVCRESYNDPLETYDKLKRLGIDLVTITDHDSIGAVEALRSRPDFFLSEEVTCTLPSGGELSRFFFSPSVQLLRHRFNVRHWLSHSVCRTHVAARNVTAAALCAHL